MAGRIRSIKPEVLEDEIAAGMSDAAWRMWVSSWVLADDHGNLRAGSKYLAANVWQDTTRDAETPLKELLRKGRFQPYAVKGQRYVHVHAWDKHQRIDNASNPRLPTPNQDDGTWNQGVTSDSSESLREPPRVSATLGEIPLAPAPAHDRRETPTPTPTPTPTNDQATPIATETPAAPVVGSDEPTRVRSTGVRSVFEHWVAAQSKLTGTDPSKLKLTKDRRGKIEARLNEKYTVEDLKLAIDGVFATPFNIEKHFTDVELACRNGSHVDRYIAAARKKTNGAATNGASKSSHAYPTIHHVGKKYNLQPDGSYVAEDGSVLPGSQAS